MNNNRYDGMWHTDYQEGEGTMTYYNGDLYTGTWHHDKRNGQVLIPGKVERSTPANGRMT